MSQQFDVQVNEITQRKSHLPERASEVFAAGAERTVSAGPRVKELHAKIGQMAMENDSFGRRARSHRRCERKTMIEASHALPVVRQWAPLDLSRSSVYRTPQPVFAGDLALRRAGPSPSACRSRWQTTLTGHSRFQLSGTIIPFSREGVWVRLVLDAELLCSGGMAEEIEPLRHQ